MYRLEDITRLAAFIDGEGCISIYGTDRSRRKPQTKATFGRPADPEAEYRCWSYRIRICNCDARLPAWLKSTFGGSMRLGRKAGPHNSALWDWDANRLLAAELLRECLPWLVIKREQAQVLLDFDATMSRRGRLVSKETLNERLELKAKLSSLKATARILPAINLDESNLREEVQIHDVQ